MPVANNRYGRDSTASYSKNGSTLTEKCCVAAIFRMGLVREAGGFGFLG
jgi:hypothetical protein